MVQQTRDTFETLCDALLSIIIYYRACFDITDLLNTIMSHFPSSTYAMYIDI